MHWTNPRPTIPGSLVGWKAVWWGLGLLLSVWPACVLGQDLPLPSSPRTGATSAWQDSVFYSDAVTGRRGAAFGALVRAGALVGEGVGREESIFPAELMPYFFLEDGMIFGDLRGFRGNNDRWGFNTGVGYRHYFPAIDRIFGVNAFWGEDDLSQATFRQYGFGLETLGAGWDMRLNAYFPTGDIVADLGRPELLIDSLRFDANRILFDQQRQVGTALRGVEHDIAIPLPGRWLRQHDVRAGAGWYNFQNEDISTFGWHGRLQGEITPNVQLALDVTNDTVFDTNVYFSVNFQYGGFRESSNKPKTQFDRMTTPIQRNYHVVVARNTVVDPNLVAQRFDGRPYFVKHVASDPVNPDLTAVRGTVRNPFLSIAEAQPGTGEDIIYVHTNSVFENVNVATERGVRILGEFDNVDPTTGLVRYSVDVDGVLRQTATHTFFVNQFQDFYRLPRANDATDDPNSLLFVEERKPLLLNSPGNAVTLVSGLNVNQRTEFSGFQLGAANDGDDSDPSELTTGPEQDGISAEGVEWVAGRFNDINFAGRDGISMSNITTQTSDSVLFEANRVFNAHRHGLYFRASTGDATFRGDPSLFDPNVVLLQSGTRLLGETLVTVPQPALTNPGEGYNDIPFEYASLAFDPTVGTRSLANPVGVFGNSSPIDRTTIVGDAVRIENTGSNSDFTMGGIRSRNAKPSIIVYGELLELDTNDNRIGPDLRAVNGDLVGARAGGIVVDNADGDATFGIVRVTNTRPRDVNNLNSVGTPGISITDSNGRYGFSGFFDPNRGDPDLPDVLLTRTGANFADPATGLQGNGAVAESIRISTLGQDGSVVFNGDVEIRDRAAQGVNLQGNAGDVSFNRDLFIIPLGGENNDGEQFGFTRDRRFNPNDPDDPSNPTGFPPVTSSPGFTVEATAAGIEYQESSGDATFRTVVIDSGFGSGILIGTEDNDGTIAAEVGNTGRFVINGREQNGQDSFIRNMGQVSLLVLSDDARIEVADLTIEDRGNTAVGTAGNPLSLNDPYYNNFFNDEAVVFFRHRGTANFNGTLTIEGDVQNFPFEDQTAAMVLIENGPLQDPVTGLNQQITIQPNGLLTSVAGDLSFNVVDINDAVASEDDAQSLDPAGTGVAGVVVSQNPGSVRITQLNVDGTLGPALFAREVGTVFQLDETQTDEELQLIQPSDGLVISGGTVEITDGPAIDIAYSNINIRFNEVSSSDSLRTGIRLVNNVALTEGSASFRVLPDAALSQIDPGDGGTITDAAEDGILVVNSGLVEFSGMIIEDSAEEGIDHRVSELLASQLPLPLPFPVPGLRSMTNLIGLNQYSNEFSLVANPTGLAGAPNSRFGYFTTRAPGRTDTGTPLNNADIQRAILRDGLPHGLTVRASQFTDNAESGIQTMSVPTVTVIDSDFEDNGGIGSVGRDPSIDRFTTGLGDLDPQRRDFIVQQDGVDTAFDNAATTPIPDDDDPQIYMSVVGTPFGANDPNSGLPPVYNWTLTGNVFDHTAPFSTVRADVTTDVTDVALNLLVDGSSSRAGRFGSFSIGPTTGSNNLWGAVQVQWNGVVVADIRNNQFNLSQDAGNTDGGFARLAGVLIRNEGQGAEGVLDNNITVFDNSFDIQDDDAFGVDINLPGSSVVRILGTSTDLSGAVDGEPGPFQRFLLGGIGNRAISLNLQSQSSAFVENNVILSNVITNVGSRTGFAAEGIIFENIRSATRGQLSSARVSGNIIQFGAGGGLTNFGLYRGIVFDSVTGTIQLSSQTNNEVTLFGVQQAGPPWFIYQGATAPNGNLIINNTAVP
jgi:hypothetical protein